MRPAGTCLVGSRRIVHLHPVHSLRHKPRWKLLRQTYLCHRILPLRTMVYPHCPLPAGNKFQQTQLYSRYTAAGIGIREVPAYLDKYLLLLPLFCGLLIACLKGLLSLSGSEFLQYFATHITMFRIHNTQILTNAILHASAFIGYFAFSRQVLLKSFTIFVGSIAVCIGIVTFVASLMPEARADGYWIDNIATWPNTNYPLSAGTQAIVTFCNYAAPISVLLGSWVSSYFLLKENNCSLWTSRPTNRYTSRL